MRLLADVQAEFAAALRDPMRAAPDNLVGPDAAPSPRRFAVYRNNVTVGLTKALAGSFPAVQRIVGEDFFEAMARAYVAAEPPCSPLLIDYGITFADFVARFEPAASLPYLPDVARIERARREAYHAEDAVPLTPDAFAGLAEADLPELVFRLHPSLRLVRSAYAAQTVWEMNAGESEAAPADWSVAEDTLILRPDMTVDVRKVPPGGAEFIDALASGQPLGQAAGRAVAADEGFDLAGNLAGLISAGAVVADRPAAIARA